MALLPNEPRTIYISRRKFWRVVIALLIIVGLIGGWTFHNLTRGGLSIGTDYMMEGIPSVPRHSGGEPVYDYVRPPSYGGQPDITDTREFMKTNYSASIESRDVQRDVSKVEDAIDDVSGRIDRISSTERYGNISFVIPKSNLSEFRDEIEKIAHAKLYTENISSTNRLEEKQSIEARAEHAAMSLSELETERASTDAAYLAENSRLQNQLFSLQTRLSDIQEAIASLPEDTTDAFLVTEQQSAIDDINSTRYLLTTNNQSYTSKRASLDAAIERAGGRVTDVAKVDTEFMDDIETVAASISIRRVSLYEYVRAFSPTPMWMNNIIIVIFFIWLLKRLHIIPRIRLV